jgi:hypothetical protein
MAVGREQGKMVPSTGLEPVTSTMSMWRSTSWANWAKSENCLSAEASAKAEANWAKSNYLNFYKQKILLRFGNFINQAACEKALITGWDSFMAMKKFSG